MGFTDTDLPESAVIVSDQEQNTVIQQVMADTNDNKELKEGVCKALCMRWIVQGHQNKDFWGTLTEDGVFEEVANLQNTENRFVTTYAKMIGVTINKDGSFSEEEFRRKKTEIKANWSQVAPDTQKRIDRVIDLHDTWAATDVGTKARIDRKAKHHMLDPGVVGTAGEEMVKAPGYYLMHMYLKNGGHTVVAHVGADRVVHFMDPNFGEAKFVPATSMGEQGQRDFATWMSDKYLSRYAYAYDGFKQVQIDYFPCTTQMNRPDEQESQRQRYVSSLRQPTAAASVAGPAAAAAAYTPAAAAAAYTPPTPLATAATPSATAATPPAGAATPAVGPTPAQRRWDPEKRRGVKGAEELFKPRR